MRSNDFNWTLSKVGEIVSTSCEKETSRERERRRWRGKGREIDVEGDGVVVERGRW